MCHYDNHEISSQNFTNLILIKTRSKIPNICPRVLNINTLPSTINCFNLTIFWHKFHRISPKWLECLKVKGTPYVFHKCIWYWNFSGQSWSTVLKLWVCHTWNKCTPQNQRYPIHVFLVPLRPKFNVFYSASRHFRVKRYLKTSRWHWTLKNTLDMCYLYPQVENFNPFRSTISDFWLTWHKLSPLQPLP